ncbi:uncharacterized protein [Amphiura filiformis]|uniref:uncharacterized protein isoform X1 n=1 Tax=Amphiura filiformis TaxID=82378 RepID=UPI003B20FB6F
MEPASSNKNLYEKDASVRNGNSKLLLVVVVIALCFAIAAFILAMVSLVTQKDGSASQINLVGGAAGLTTADYDDDKVWLIHTGHSGTNSEYINEETGRVEGFNPDIMNAVCRIANKNCALVFDVYTNCWDNQAGESARGGFGLMAGWFDACGAWRVKPDRQRTFAFSDTFSRAPFHAFMTLTGNPEGFNWRDITGKTIGFIDGFSADEHCLAKADAVTGAVLPAENIVHCVDFEECYDRLVANTIDAAFMSVSKIRGQSSVEIASEEFNACQVQGFGMMARFDNKLIEWWNPAQEKLLASKEYHEICKDVKIAHGHMPGYEPADFCIGL